MCGEDKSCGCKTADTIVAAPVVEAETPDVPTDEVLPDKWHAVLTVEGLRTTDHRLIAANALAWRQLPLALFAQFGNATHFDAPIVGQITSITRDDATGRIMAEGTFDLSIDEGRKAARMCKNQTLRWGSVDLEVMESRYVEVGTSDDVGEMVDALFDESPTPADWYDEVLEGRIMGHTMIATPAFPQAVIAPEGVELIVPEPMGTASIVTDGLRASAVPAKPPLEWFADPQLQEATPLTVSSDGRVFGHLALWDTCHIGFQDACVTPPRSNWDYAYFLVGDLETAAGEMVRVGHITYDTGHAGATMGWQDTAAHYDNTGAVAADVVVGEDEFGIWVAGSMRPGLDENAVRAVRSAPLSGDWRRIGGGLELVAALCVNTPGFPIVASAGMKQKEQVSLIASAVRKPSPVVELARELAQLKAAVAPLLGLSVQQLSQRVKPRTQATVVDIQDLRDRVNLGGDPSQGTPKDKRLKDNKKKKPPFPIAK